MTKLSSTALLAIAAGSVASCGALSNRSAAPDEFRVLKKAPLTVPPEFSLRPPGATESRPAEVASDRQTSSFAFGQELGTDASEVERMLIAEAGANAVDPRIRVIVDYETGKILRKPSEFADQILSTGDTSTAEAGDSATGGGDVVIERSGGKRIKLPGT